MYCSFFALANKRQKNSGLAAWRAVVPRAKNLENLSTSTREMRGTERGLKFPYGPPWLFRFGCVNTTRRECKEARNKKKDNTPVQSFPLRAFLESGVKVGYGEGKGRRTVSGLRPLSRERKVRKLTYSDFRLLQGVRILTLICVRSLLLGRVNA